MGGNWHQVVKQAAIFKVNEAAKIKRFTGLTGNWRNKCLRRDGYKCLLCGGKKDLQVHHIERWHDAPHRRLEVRNGATLCKQCHDTHHNGKGEAFPKEITVKLMALVLGLPPLHKTTKTGFFLVKHHLGITPPQF